MQPRPKTAFENHFASEHGGKEPRGMTPYEYACYKPYADQECRDTFRKYLEISETAELTRAKIAYAEKMERDGLIKTDAQVCYLCIVGGVKLDTFVQSLRRHFGNSDVATFIKAFLDLTKLQRRPFSSPKCYVLV